MGSGPAPAVKGPSTAHGRMRRLTVNGRAEPRGHLVRLHNVGDLGCLREEHDGALARLPNPHRSSAALTATSGRKACGSLMGRSRRTSYADAAGAITPRIEQYAFPPRDSCSKRVSFDSRQGIAFITCRSTQVAHMHHHHFPQRRRKRSAMLTLALSAPDVSLRPDSWCTTFLSCTTDFEPCWPSTCTANTSFHRSNRMGTAAWASAHTPARRSQDQ